MRMSKEDFCSEYGLTEEQFCGRETINGVLWLVNLKYLPEGCTLNCSSHICLFYLKELPEGCSLTANYIYQYERENPFPLGEGSVN